MNKQQPKLNLRLLRKVRNRIAEIPESYDQSEFCRPASDAPCGTAACLAGETIICAARTVSAGIEEATRLTRLWIDGWEDRLSEAAIVQRAAELLGIEIEDAVEMFEGEPRWPQPFRRDFAKADTQAEQATVAVAYLDECLKRKAVTW